MRLGYNDANLVKDIFLSFNFFFAEKTKKGSKERPRGFYLVPLLTNTPNTPS